MEFNLMTLKIIIANFMLGFVVAVFTIAILGWINDVKEEKAKKEKQ